VTKHGYYWQEQQSGIFTDIHYWSKEDIQPVSNDVFKKVMANDFGRFEIGKRIIFPGWGKYRKISVEFKLLWTKIHDHQSYYRDFIVLPYKFDYKGGRVIDTGDHLLAWVFDHRKDKKVTIKQIKKLYAELLLEIEEIMNKPVD
jgi:hypothetical protein